MLGLIRGGVPQKQVAAQQKQQPFAVGGPLNTLVLHAPVLKSGGLGALDGDGEFFERIDGEQFLRFLGVRAPLHQLRAFDPDEAAALRVPHAAGREHGGGAAHPAFLKALESDRFLLGRQKRGDENEGRQ